MRVLLWKLQPEAVQYAVLCGHGKTRLVFEAQASHFTRGLWGLSSLRLGVEGAVLPPNVCQ